MEYRPLSSSMSSSIKPRLIIHGGAGNITPNTLPPAQYRAYHSSLLSIVSNTYQYLLTPHNALDTVTFAVTQLENNPLFNSGKGAVFTRDGVNELEASIMVSSGKKKRGVGVMGLRHVKNPIKLAREILVRGEDDIDGGNGEHRGPMTFQDGHIEAKSPSGGAQGHCQLYGEGAEILARKWGLEIVDEGYFFVQKRWDEHVKGLEREREGKGYASWDKEKFLPQGTCGAVALDENGVCAVATSTGGMTNKLTGRIGDTPTLGAGFWAEQWETSIDVNENQMNGMIGPILSLSDSLKALLADCFPSLATYSPVAIPGLEMNPQSKEIKITSATAISGTGNGDSFLRMNACRTASAIARYGLRQGLKDGVKQITGQGGELQKSAGDRWEKTGEGEGGMIGIECVCLYNAKGEVTKYTTDIVEDFNCGGMFRALITNEGKAVARVWRPGHRFDLMEKYDAEGREYDSREWLSEKS